MSVKKWSTRFRTGLESLVDYPRLGQVNTVITIDLIHKADGLLGNDCHVKWRMLAEKVNVSIGTVWTIVHERLRYRKVCEHGVPKRLIDQQKELSMGIAFQGLIWYHENLTFLESKQKKCYSPCFLPSKVHYC